MRTVAVLLMTMMAALLSSETRAQEKPKPPPREAFRYDGKSFEAWRKYCQEDLKLELKPERRIEGIRAMRAFGSNGYGAEAAEVVVDFVRIYPERDLDRSWGKEKSAGLEPEQVVCYEAIQALRRIGPAATPALLAYPENKTVRYLAALFLASDGEMVLPVEAIPRVVEIARSKVSSVRDLALCICRRQLEEERFVEAIEKNGNYEKVFRQVLRTMRDPASEFSELLTRVIPQERAEYRRAERLLTELALNRPMAIKNILVEELRDLKAARQKDVEEEKKSAFPFKVTRVGVPLQGGDYSVREDKEPWEKYLPRFDSLSRDASVTVVRVLGNVGPAARDALPELREAAQDPCLALQAVAKDAIAKIQKKP